ncbi:serine/threonine-protein phosphatase 6 regulatory subunit 2-like [Corapipo altera]|uniref:serine/threonine-protein phosphatase 6 regulatory subunit 2-like n=1 Tax=Corapipo altera TaxID=415028 RepID=UPI000FD65123|nr:serine/threonine-protein phosphatase 6 regulatory subunit 2-like [Corapipo altera]
MFDGEQTENCIVNGTQVLLTLLETRRSGVEGLMDSYTQGFERSYTVNSSILHGIEPRLKDFHQLLLSPPKKSAILTTIGVLEEPLGNARLHGSRLIAALLHTNTPSINQELCRLSTMDLLLVSIPAGHGERGEGKDFPLGAVLLSLSSLLCEGGRSLITALICCGSIQPWNSLCNPHPTVWDLELSLTLNISC